jgi:hypothetical protein
MRRLIVGEDEKKVGASLFSRSEGSNEREKGKAERFWAFKAEHEDSTRKTQKLYRSGVENSGWNPSEKPAGDHSRSTWVND